MTSAPLRFSRFDDLFDPGARPRAESRWFMSADKTSAAPAHKGYGENDGRTRTDGRAIRLCGAL